MYTEAHVSEYTEAHVSVYTEAHVSEYTEAVQKALGCVCTRVCTLLCEADLLDECVEVFRLEVVADLLEELDGVPAVDHKQHLQTG